MLIGENTVPTIFHFNEGIQMWILVETILPLFSLHSMSIIHVASKVKLSSLSP